MSPKHSNLYLIIFLLFTVHAIEESMTRFFDSDPLIIAIAHYLSLRPDLIFYTIQFIWLTFLFILSAAGKKISTRSWFVIIMGLVFILELGHIGQALLHFSYYPGLYTALILIIYGLYCWRGAAVSRS